METDTDIGIDVDDTIDTEYYAEFIAEILEVQCSHFETTEPDTN